MNKWQIEKLVANNLRDIAYDGEVSEATNTGTYGVLTCSSFPFDHSTALQGGRLVVGEEDLIVKVFAPTDKKVYVLPAFTSVPTAGDEFTIFRTRKKEEYDNTFLLVFNRLRLKQLESAEASLAVGSEQYLYQVPTTWSYINKVELHASGGTIPVALPFVDWKMRNGYVGLGKIYSPDSYPTIRFLGQKHPDTPTLATASVENAILQDCLIQRMTEYLGMRNVSGEQDSLLPTARNAGAMADALEFYLFDQVKLNSRRVE